MNKSMLIGIVAALLAALTWVDEFRRPARDRRLFGLTRDLS